MSEVSEAKNTRRRILLRHDRLRNAFFVATATRPTRRRVPSSRPQHCRKMLLLHIALAGTSIHHLSYTRAHAHTQVTASINTLSTAKPLTEWKHTKNNYSSRFIFPSLVCVWESVVSNKKQMYFGQFLLLFGFLHVLCHLRSMADVACNYTTHNTATTFSVKIIDREIELYPS